MAASTVPPMAAGAQPVARVRGLALSARAFRRLALANTAMLVVIIASGATVRLTGSGLGCRHWPGCRPGAFLPDKGYHSYIEFSNRFVAGVTILLALATLIGSLLTRFPTWGRAVAAVMFAGAAAQAPLGKITVDHDLNPWLVLSHFLLSIAVLALGVLVAIEAWGVRARGEPHALRAAALGVAAACGTLVVTGTLVTASGPHSGSVAVPRGWSFHPAVWLHVRATAVFGIGLAAVLLWLWRRRSPELRRALPILAVLAAQMLVGEVQYRTHLPWWLVLVHVALAASLWATVVAFVVVLWRPAAPA
jgi:heme a synthase